MHVKTLRGEAGISMVELVVAMAIGLILMSGIYKVFIGSTKSFRDQESLARLQENVRMAMNVAARDIRAAGYPRFSLNGTGFTGGDAITPGDCTGVNCSDTVAVRYCTGNCEGITPTIGTFTFSVANDVLQRNGLDVVEGVENMQVLYGLEGATDDRSVESYVDDFIPGTDLPLVVRIRLLLRTIDEVPEAAIDTEVYDVDGDGVPEFDPDDDRRLRRIFTTTITLRNMLR